MPLDDRLRKGLPGLASGVDPEMDEALARVLRAGRRRKVVRGVAAGAAAVAIVAAGAVVAPRVIDAVRGDRPTGFAGDPSPEPDGKRGVGSALELPGRCTGPLGVEPTYLPPGFSTTPAEGAAPGAPPLEAGQGAIYWTDGERAIEIRRPGMLFVELAQEEGAEPITVLGQETVDYGPLAPNYEQGPAGEDFMVQFRHPATADPSGDPSKDCSFFSITEYGLDADDLIRVAEGLRAA